MDGNGDPPLESSSTPGVQEAARPRPSWLTPIPPRTWQRNPSDINKRFCLLSEGEYPKRVTVEPFMGQWRIDIRKVRLHTRGIGFKLPGTGRLTHHN